MSFQDMGIEPWCISCAKFNNIPCNNGPVASTFQDPVVLCSAFPPPTHSTLKKVILQKLLNKAEKVHFHTQYWKHFRAPLCTQLPILPVHGGRTAFKPDVILGSVSFEMKFTKCNSLLNCSRVARLQANRYNNIEIQVERNSECYGSWNCSTRDGNHRTKGTVNWFPIQDEIEAPFDHPCLARVSLQGMVCV